MPAYRVLAAAAALLGSLTLAGCANHEQAAGPESTSPTYAAVFPTTVTVPGGAPVTIAKRPQRIVSLDASDTEILYAVGAGSQVVAVDKDSDYPTTAPKTTLDSTSPSVEAIAAKNPDLVVTGYDTNNLAANLKKLNIPVLLVTAPKTVDSAYQLWSAIGQATGHRSEADNAVNTTKQDIAKIVADTPKPKAPLTYYYELDQTFYTATSHTFIGSLLGQFGLTNIADPADTVASAGYPQLSAEKVLSANPNLVFLADSQCCSQNATTVAARPGWSTLNAVRNGNVVTLNDDIASRWAPRIVDLMRTASAAVVKAEHSSSGS